MSVEAGSKAGRAAPPIVNIPNALSAARLVLAAVAVGLIEVGWYAPSLAVFLVAAITDAMDGAIARRLGQETAFGRQLDPMIDKLMIATALIFLVAVPGSGVRPWMASVIVARELVIQWLRSMLEGRGVAFGAKASGKLKTVVQCAAIVAALLVLALGSPMPWLVNVRDLLLWTAVVLTIWSAVEYFVAAAPRLRERPPTA